MSLSKRDHQTIWHPYTQQATAEQPVAIVKAKGAYLYDEDGRKYIDAIASWWTNIHGHSHPYIAKKISEQAKKLEHVIFAGFTHPPAIELAERLLKLLPSNQDKIFYSDNGSTAVEVALKMAFQYWSNKGIKKNKIIALTNAYHGDTFGAMAVSGRSAFTKAFDELLFEVIYLDPAELESKVQNPKSKVSKSDKIDWKNVAGFIFEPLIQGSAGMLMYETDVLKEIMKFSKQHNFITIADEVMTGFGRTGKMFAVEHADIQPDIICLSKGITGGAMAMGVTSCSKEIYKAFLSEDKSKTLFHGHSYTGNPISCAAALANLDLFEKKETWKNIDRISHLHKEFAKNIKHKNIKDIRQRGTILAIELQTKENTSYLNPIRDKAYRYFLKKGIILRPLGNVIYLLPPYCISDKDLKYIYKTIHHFLDTL